MSFFKFLINHICFCAISNSLSPIMSDIFLEGGVTSFLEAVFLLESEDLALSGLFLTRSSIILIISTSRWSRSTCLIIRLVLVSDGDFAN